MDFISVREAANRWKLSERRVQKLCEDGRIAGVFRFGRSWAIPKETEKPLDMRFNERNLLIKVKPQIKSFRRSYLD